MAGIPESSSRATHLAIPLESQIDIRRNSMSSSATSGLNANSNFLSRCELYPNLLARLRGTPAQARRNASRADRQEILTTKPRRKMVSPGTRRPPARPRTAVAGASRRLRRGSGRSSPQPTCRIEKPSKPTIMRPLEKILEDFRTAREKLLQRVGELNAIYLATIPHPRLKTPMRLVDHLYFVAEHDDHHLARIWELLNADEEGRLVTACCLITRSAASRSPALRRSPLPQPPP